MMQLAATAVIALFSAGMTCSVSNAGGIAQTAAKAAVARAMLAKEAARDAAVAAVRGKASVALVRASAIRQQKHVALGAYKGNLLPASAIQPQVARLEAVRTGKPAQVVISRGRYPETAAHIKDAQRLGQPSVLTIDRAGATERRRDSLRYLERRAGRQIVGRDRDEYPPAMTREGGFNSDVRYVRAADNRGAGKNFAQQVRDLPDGSRVRVLISE